MINSMAAEGMMIFQAADPAGNFSQSTTETVLMTYTLGEDTMKGGYGNDVLYGDLEDLTMDYKSANNVSGDFALSEAGDDGNIYQFGSDLMEGNSGQDKLYGDIKNWTINMKAGDNAGPNTLPAVQIVDTATTFGDDVMKGGSEQDELYGDLKNWTMTFKGGDNAGDSSLPIAVIIPGGQANISSIAFGADTLEGGNGNDILVGDVETVVMNFDAGHNGTGGSGGFLGATVTAAAILGTDLTFGADVMDGGDGNDQMYGDVKLWDMDFQGALNVNGNLSVGNLAALVGSAGIGPDTATGKVGGTIFGNDVMDGGEGHDVMYGDGETMSLNATGGSIDTPGAFVDVRAGIDNPVIFGDDTMNGGDGNDVMYGDWENIDITLVDGLGFVDLLGVGVLNDASAFVAALTFGNDIIDGGAGDDFIVGDVMDVNFSHEIYSGFNVIIVNEFGGLPLGQDDPLTLINSGNSLVEDVVVTWGDDVLTGGLGDDTFFFEIQDAGGLMQMQGDDIITDLGDLDVLQFADVLDMNGDLVVDVADLDDQTIFTDVNAGADVRVDFDGGGSITLEGYGSLGIIDFSDLEAASGATVVI